MEQLFNGFTLDIPPGAFPFSTDSVVLSSFIRLPRQARVLDLGSGCGTLGVLLCSQDASCHVTGIEIDEAAHRGAVENIRRNALEARMGSICADLRELSDIITPGSYHCCVSNPPYFSGGISSRTHATARQEGSCNPDDLFRAAAWALKYGGDFFLIHKPERLAELICKSSKHGLEAKRLRLIRHRENGPVALIALQFRKGGKPGLIWEEDALFDVQGNPTPYYHQMYHLQHSDHPL